ncbi:phosphoribosyltransferase domain-containing protein [Candidatus Woesearchaeota archaeon]|nr:phosphoribosyltransferase domain-containing protein [Candidatus Woesearchaeota archaeon]
MNIGLGMYCVQELSHRISLEQSLEICEDHFPMRNPELTEEVLKNPEMVYSLEDVFKKRLTDSQIVISVEDHLLNNWSKEGCWRKYLDQPLIAHATAGLTLKNLGFDAVVGIESAGLPYAEILEMVGLKNYSINFSHHKKDMNRPKIKQYHREKLRECEKVCLVDVDFVTGKTFRVVTDYLRKMGINVEGLYTGLSMWPGINNEFKIKGREINFNRFWIKNDSISSLGMNKKDVRSILPEGVQLYGPNVKSDLNSQNISVSNAKKVAKYLVEK